MMVSKKKTDWFLIGAFAVAVVLLYVLFPVQASGEVFMAKEYDFGDGPGYVVGLMSDEGGVLLVEASRMAYKRAEVGKHMTIWSSRW